MRLFVIFGQKNEFLTRICKKKLTKEVKSHFLTPLGFVLLNSYVLAIVLEKVLERVRFLTWHSFLEIFKNVEKCMENEAFLNLNM